jgi:hypothetical protein
MPDIKVKVYNGYNVKIRGKIGYDAKFDLGYVRGGVRVKDVSEVVDIGDTSVFTFPTGSVIDEGDGKVRITFVPFGSVIWGDIGGTLSSQIDLQNALNAKTDELDFLAHTGDFGIHFTEASINHANIQGIGTNTHAQIDSHIADAAVHFLESSIDHTSIQGIGLNTHAEIDSHIGDSTIHFTEANIDHNNILNVGTNTHAHIDDHIGDNTIHFTVGEIHHGNLLDSGTKTHAQIDSHIDDSTIHFLEEDISHFNLRDIGSYAHTQIDSHITTSTIHFTKGSISHTEIQDIGTNTHTEIDSHIANPLIHFTKTIQDGSAQGQIAFWYSIGGTWVHAEVDEMFWDDTEKEFTSVKLKSTVVTGTAPFTVASTTLVSNLNADFLDGKHASAFYPSANIDDGTAAGQIPFWNGTKYTHTEIDEAFWEDTIKRLELTSPAGDQLRLWNNLGQPLRIAHNNFNECVLDLSEATSDDGYFNFIGKLNAELALRSLDNTRALYFGCYQDYSYMVSPTDVELQLGRVGGNMHIYCTPDPQPETLINPLGKDFDCRIQSDTDTHAFFLRGSDGYIGVGEPNPDTKVEILNAGDQLKLSYADGIDTVFQTKNSGDLFITPTGDTVEFDFATHGTNYAYIQAKGVLGSELYLYNSANDYVSFGVNTDFGFIFSNKDLRIYPNTGIGKLPEHQLDVLEDIKARNIKLNSGIYSSVGLSINADPTKFDIGDVYATFVEYDSLGAKTITHAYFPGQTGVSAAALGSATGVWIGRDKTGTIIQQVDDFSREQLDTIARVGRLGRFNYPNITSVFDFPLTYETDTDFASYVMKKGTIKLEGGEIEVNSTDLSLKRLAARCLRIGAGDTRDKINFPVSAESAGFSFLPAYRNTDDSAILEASSTQIEVSKYDDGSGTLQTMADGYYSNRYIYFFPYKSTQTVFVIYGHDDYASMQAALEVAGTAQDFFVPTDIRGGVLLAAVTVKKGITNLTQAVSDGDAVITNSDLDGKISAFTRSLENTVFVNSMSDLPAPIGGKIYLAKDTIYKGNGRATTLATSYDIVFQKGAQIHDFYLITSGRIDALPGGSIALWRSTVVGTGTEIITAPNLTSDYVSEFFYTNIVATNSNVKVFDMHSASSEPVLLIDRLSIVCQSGGNLGEINDVTIEGDVADISGFSEGLSFTGNRSIELKSILLEGDNTGGTYLEFKGDISQIQLRGVGGFPGSNEYFYNFATYDIGSELVTNGDMELDSNWSDRTQVPLVNERSSEQVRSGDYSRKFTVDAQYEGIISDAFSLTSGNTYRATVWVYGNGTTQMALRVNSESTGPFKTYYPPIAPDLNGYLFPERWYRVQWEFTPTTTENHYITFLSGTGQTSGSWYIDDVSVVQVIDTPPGVIAVSGGTILLDKSGVSSDNILEPGSWDSTTLGNKFSGNINIPDSTARIEAEVSEGITATDIPLQDALVIINTPTTWSLTSEYSERLTVATDGTTTYDDTEDAALDATVIAAVQAAVASSDCNIRFVSVKVEQRTVTFTNATNLVNETATPRVNGDLVSFKNTAGTLPTGLREDIVFYVINKTTNSFQLSYTLGGSAVAFTTDGTGTNSYQLSLIYGSKVSETVSNTAVTSISGEAQMPILYNEQIFLVIQNKSNANDLTVSEAYYKLSKI